MCISFLPATAFFGKLFILPDGDTDPDGVEAKLSRPGIWNDFLDAVIAVAMLSAKDEYVTGMKHDFLIRPETLKAAKFEDAVFAKANRDDRPVDFLFIVLVASNGCARGVVRQVGRLCLILKSVGICNFFANSENACRDGRKWLSCCGMLLNVPGTARGCIISPAPKVGVFVGGLYDVSPCETAFTVATTVTPAYASARRVVAVERRGADEAATILQKLFLLVDIQCFDYPVHTCSLSESKSEMIRYPHLLRHQAGSITYSF